MSKYISADFIISTGSDMSIQVNNQARTNNHTVANWVVIQDAGSSHLSVYSFTSMHATKKLLVWQRLCKY